VINISIRDEDDLPLFENAAAMPSFLAMKNDIFVSCTAGNTGPIYQPCTYMKMTKFNT
jgi:hypothetical protein